MDNAIQGKKKTQTLEDKRLSRSIAALTRVITTFWGWGARFCFSTSLRSDSDVALCKSSGIKSSIKTSAADAGQLSKSVRYAVYLGWVD